MQNPVELENIEEMRRQAGIDDQELRQAIRALGKGDCVNLTAVTSQSTTGQSTFETLLVRITSMRDNAFRGKLARKPASKSLAKLLDGTPILFNVSHIHSIAKVQASCERQP